MVNRGIPDGELPEDHWEHLAGQEGSPFVGEVSDYDDFSDGGEDYVPQEDLPAEEPSRGHLRNIDGRPAPGWVPEGRELDYLWYYPDPYEVHGPVENDLAWGNLLMQREMLLDNIGGMIQLADFGNDPNFYAAALKAVILPEGDLIFGSMDAPLSDYLRTEIVETPNDLGFHKRMVKQINPLTGQPFEHTAILVVQFNTNDPEAITGFMELLDSSGIRVAAGYGMTTDRTFKLEVVFDEDAPSPLDYHYFREGGYFLPAAEGPVDDIVAATLGKFFKRYKQHSESGKHFDTDYSRLDWPEDIIPIATEHGSMVMQYFPYAQGQYQPTQARGDYEPALQHDGAGAIRQSKYRRFYEITTGERFDRSAYTAQCLFSVKQLTRPDGSKYAGTIKAMFHPMDDRAFNEKIYQELVRVHGLDPERAWQQALVTDMLVSTESIPNQLANEDHATGRVIWHKAHLHPWDFGPASGHNTLPALYRIATMDEIGAKHFDHFALDAINALDKAQESMDKAQSMVEAYFPEGLDGGGRLEKGDDEYFRNQRRLKSLQSQWQHSQEALDVGNIFAGIEAMAASKPNQIAKLQSLMWRAKGEDSLTLASVPAEITPPDFLPRLMRGEGLPKGKIRLFIRENRDTEGRIRYSNYLVMSPDDVVDPVEAQRHDGADYDDAFRIALFYDQRDMKIKGKVIRSPVSPGGTGLYEMDPRDLEVLINKYGMPVYQMRNPEQLDSPYFGEYEGDLHLVPQAYAAERYPERETQEIAKLMNSADPRDFREGMVRYIAMITDTGRIGVVSNLGALVVRSGWIDDNADLSSWGMNFSGNLDVEAQALGHNTGAMHSLAAAIVDDVLDNGSKLDRQTVEGRFRQMYNSLSMAYADRRMREMGLQDPQWSWWDRKTRNQAPPQWHAFVREWPQVLANNQTLQTLSRWQEVDVWSSGTRLAAATLDRMHDLLPNGPIHWLLAPVRPQPFPDRGESGYRHILPRVNREADRLVSAWRSISAQNNAALNDLNQLEMSESRIFTRGWSWPRRMAWLEFIKADWRTQGWKYFDELVRAAESRVEGLDGYERGMLMAAVTQNDLRRNAEHHARPTEDLINKGPLAVRPLRHRVYQGFSHEEKLGFYNKELPNGKAASFGPTLAVTWNPRSGLWYEKPWMRWDDDHGVHVDSRSDGKYSHVRYHPQERRLGPFVPVTGETNHYILKTLTYMGYEFRYSGAEVGNRQGLALFHVVKAHKTSAEQMRIWMQAHFVYGIPMENLPEPWEDIDELRKEVSAHLHAMGGQPAQITPERREILQAVNWEVNRFEFGDEVYDLELPPEYRSVVERVAGPPPAETPDPNQGELFPMGDQPNAAQSGLPLRQDDPNARPAPAAGSRDIEAYDQAEEAKRRSVRVDLARREIMTRGVRDASVDPETGQIFRTRGSPDLPMTLDKNRLGGAAGNQETLRLIFEEFRKKHDERLRVSYETGEEYQSYRPTQEGGAMAAGLPRSPYDDSLWDSEHAKGMVTSREVAYAYNEYVRWARGAQTMTPGLGLAKNADEAATLLLYQMRINMDLLLARNETMGYWRDTGEKDAYRQPIMEHTMGKTEDLASRARWKLNVYVPNPMALPLVSALRFTYAPRRRYDLENRVGKYIREHSVLQEYEPFDGDQEKMKRATPQELEREMARVAYNAAVNEKDVAVAAFLKRAVELDKGIEIRGRTIQPGFIQIASEIKDAFNDLKEGGRYLQHVMADVEGQRLKALVQMQMRNAVTDTMVNLGLPADDMRALYRNNPELVPELEGMADRLTHNPRTEDFKKMLGMARASWSAFRAGDWSKAVAEIKAIESVPLYRWYRNHHMIYLVHPFGDPSGRGAGRVVSGVSPGPTFGFLDLNPGITDRQAMEMGDGIRKAIYATADKYLETAMPDLHRRLHQIRGDVEERVTLDLDLSKALDDMLLGKKRGALSVALVTKVNWWGGLTKGVGASILHRSFREHNVPIKKRWIINRRPNVDELCLGNTRQGWVQNNENFRSGHGQPPAHPGCKCKLQLSISAEGEGKALGMLAKAARPMLLTPSQIGRKMRI